MTGPDSWRPHRYDDEASRHQTGASRRRYQGGSDHYSDHSPDRWYDDPDPGDYPRDQRGYQHEYDYQAEYEYQHDYGYQPGYPDDAGEGTDDNARHGARHDHHHDSWHDSGQDADEHDDEPGWRSRRHRRVDAGRRTRHDNWDDDAPRGRRDESHARRRYSDGDRRPAGQSRLQRREVERRQQAQRRRRTAIFAILLVAGVLAGVDFARGGLIGPSPADVQATDGGRYINPPDPANETSASPTPSKSGRPSVPYSGSGKFVTVEGESEVLGTSGNLLSYQVRIEKDLEQDPAEFAEYLDTTLGDKRSWVRGGDVRFQRISSGDPDFTIYLATPTTTDRLCAPLQTSGFTSCRQGDDVVLNFARWVLGVEHWDGDLESYRRYVINHEVGHRLGHQHELCTGKGDPAPVMQQQTLKLAGCKGNPWPYVDGKLHKGPAGSYGGT